jgi:hypothetical protein
MFRSHHMKPPPDVGGLSRLKRRNPTSPAPQLDDGRHAQSVPAHKAAGRTPLHPVFAADPKPIAMRMPPFAAAPDTKTDSTMPPGGQ